MTDEAATSEHAMKSPKVTVREKPSEEMVREATKETTITDAKGRRIQLTRPGVLAQYKLVLLVGGEAASNQVYMQMVLPLLYVSAIDGDTVNFPASDIELDALIQRLDEDGIASVMAAVQEKFSPADPKAERAQVKN